MNTLDIILSVILCIGVIRGFMKGFIFEIAVLGTLFILYFFGFRLAAYASPYVEKIISGNPQTIYYASLLFTWIAISIGMYFLAKLFEGLVNMVALGIFNKIAGAVLGGMKYALILSLFLFFFNKIELDTKWLNEETKKSSVLYYPLMKISETVVKAF